MSRWGSSDDRNSSRSNSDNYGAPNLCRGKSGCPSSADSSPEISEAELCCSGANFLRRQLRYSPRKVMKFGMNNTCLEDAESSTLELQVPSPSPQRSRILTSQSPSPRHRCRGA
ncbi:hypothetical protein TNIN_156561 [Trichonephila inaurata madagascariensis]|uniref:Uncharacterized protein n=1 Tax=Trichonephila inaurata madagascariensis TaxID=2747483 RepID=A0A8X6XJA6_9ARAC|nr:hypothetical protein TNIN_156561 [Trichonephila inaurata madagascariensis]